MESRNSHSENRDMWYAFISLSRGWLSQPELEKWPRKSPTYAPIHSQTKMTWNVYLAVEGLKRQDGFKSAVQPRQEDDTLRCKHAKSVYEPQKEMEILVIETRARPVALERCEGRDLPLIDIPWLVGPEFSLVLIMAHSTYIYQLRWPWLVSWLQATLSKA